MKRFSGNGFHGVGAERVSSKGYRETYYSEDSAIGGKPGSHENLWTEERKYAEQIDGYYRKCILHTDYWPDMEYLIRIVHDIVGEGRRIDWERFTPALRCFYEGHLSVEEVAKIAKCDEMTVYRAAKRVLGYERKKSTAGTGVYLDKKTGRWVCQPRIDGKGYYIGRFATEEEALEASLEAREMMAE